MASLVIAEHNNLQLKPDTAKAIHAASQMSPEVDVLVAGLHCRAVAEHVATLKGVRKVWLAEHQCYAHHLAENISLLVHELAPNYSHVVASATTTGKDFLPRVAALLDVGQISDIIGVQSADTFLRPIYAGNAIATVQSQARIKVLTVRSAAFEAALIGNAAPIEALNSVHDAGVSCFVEETLTQSERPELTSAKVVISGGRGVGSGENFALLEAVADKLQGAVGASRAAVDAGFVPNVLQVGQTGKIVAPDLYIAVGISGAIQHLAGMKDSKVIVAINKDPDAAIFQVADYGLVADLFEALPELAAKLP